MNESKPAVSIPMLCTTVALLALLGGCQTTPKTETGVAVEERTPTVGGAGTAFGCSWRWDMEGWLDRARSRASRATAASMA